MRFSLEAVFCECVPFSLLSRLTGALLALALATPAFPQSQAVALPRSLSQLMGEADSVVQGRVTRVVLEPHPQLRNLLVVVVTVDLEESFLGHNTGVYTFSQAAIDRRDQQQKMGYRVGQHLLLVMIRPSAYGLTSPAGMQQGRFEITRGPDGELQALNGVGNMGLFRGMASQLNGLRTRFAPKTIEQLDGQTSGPVPLQDLKTMIRALVPRKLPQ